MPPFLLSLVMSRAGVMCIVGALVLGVIGAQTLRLNHAKHDLAQTQAALVAEKAVSAGLRASVATAEQRRATEYAAATAALSEAEQACTTRVAEAHRSADAIRSLMEKPVAKDPKTGCPIAGLLGARELRDALGLPAGP